MAQKCFKNAKNCSKMQFFSSSTRRFAVALPLLELSQKLQQLSQFGATGLIFYILREHFSNLKKIISVREPNLC